MLKRILILFLTIKILLFANYSYNVEFTTTQDIDKNERILDTLGYEYKIERLENSFKFSIGPFFTKDSLDSAYLNLNSALDQKMYIFNNSSQHISNRNKSSYVGLSFGYVTSNDYDKFGNYNLSYSDDKPQTVGFLVGKNLNKNFAVEVALKSMQTQNITKTNTKDNTSINSKIEHTFISTRVRYNHPLYYRFKLFALIGVVFDKIDITNEDSKWETDISLGSGIKFNLNNNISFELMYDYNPNAIEFNSIYSF